MHFQKNLAKIQIVGLTFLGLNYSSAQISSPREILVTLGKQIILNNKNFGRFLNFQAEL